MGTEVNEVINNICDKLGILASELIPELGRMKVAEASTEIVILAVILIVSVIMLVAGTKKGRADWTDGAADVLIIAGGTGIVIAMVILAFVIPDLVGWIASPKAKTFAYVLSKLGGFQ